MPTFIEDMQRHLTTLELARWTSLDAVRDAQRTLSKVWHPDRFPNDPDLQAQATKRLQAINEAAQWFTDNAERCDRAQAGSAQDEDTGRDEEPTKRCPFCAELILVAAIKCRYCFSDLRVTATEATEDDIERAARMGNPDAQYLLGQQLMEQRPTFKTGLEWCRKAAAGGSAEAQYALAGWYVHGVMRPGMFGKSMYHGMPRDSTLAVQWYRKAAEQGVVEAQHELGACYCYGHGVPQNLQSAQDWWLKAARQGHRPSMFSLAWDYTYGAIKNPFNAYKWYLLRCGPEMDNYIRGNLFYDLRVSLGVLLKTMEQAQQQEAAQWAADRGSAFGQYILAEMYERGDVGVAPRSRIYAHKWFNLAGVQSEHFLQNQASSGRARVEKELTPEQLAEAQRLASEWKPTPI